VAFLSICDRRTDGRTDGSHFYCLMPPTVGRGLTSCYSNGSLHRQPSRQQMVSSDACAGYPVTTASGCKYSAAGTLYPHHSAARSLYFTTDRHVSSPKLPIPVRVSRLCPVSIGSGVFAGLTVVTNTQIDHAM